MIHEYIVAELQTLAPLKDNVYPVSVNLDGLQGTVAVYSYQSSTPEYDFSGNIHHYTDIVYIDLIGGLYDALCRLYLDVQSLLDGVDFDNGMGEYIFSISIDVPERDVFDPTVMLYRKSLRAQIQWAPLIEDGD